MTSVEISQQRRIEVGRERRARTRARIIAAAFSFFGEESGLYTRIEDIADRAGVTRPTFYNHFSGMAELRDAVTYEVTHDFLTAVLNVIATFADPRERASVATRLYLERARHDRQWGWSMINLSANGLIYGAETHQQAELTIREGLAEGKFDVPSSAIGRDLVLGGSLSALTTIVREAPGADYPAQMVCAVLIGLGVPPEDAAAIVARPLPLIHCPG